MPPSSTSLILIPILKELVLLSFFPTAASDAHIPSAQEAIKDRRVEKKKQFPFSFSESIYFSIKKHLKALSSIGNIHAHSTTLTAGNCSI